MDKDKEKEKNKQLASEEALKAVSGGSGANIKKFLINHGKTIGIVAGTIGSAATLAVVGIVGKKLYDKHQAANTPPPLPERPAAGSGKPGATRVVPITSVRSAETRQIAKPPELTVPGGAQPQTPPPLPPRTNFTQVPQAIKRD